MWQWVLATAGATFDTNAVAHHGRESMPTMGLDNPLLRFIGLGQ